MQPDVIIMAITSRLRDVPAFGEVRITNWLSANLLKPSAIKPVFATIEQSLILKSLGRLQQLDLAAIREAIFSIFV